RRATRRPRRDRAVRARPRQTHRTHRRAPRRRPPPLTKRHSAGHGASRLPDGAPQPLESGRMSSPVTLPSDRVLSGTLIQLVPLTREHLPALLDIAYANSAEFRLTSTPVDADQAEFYFGMAFEDVAAGTAYVVAVLDSSGDVIGTTRLA